MKAKVDERIVDLMQDDEERNVYKLIGDLRKKK